jgi:hypothetical protein
MNIEKVQVGLMGAFIAGVGVTGVLIGSKFLAISAIVVATLAFMNEASGNIEIVARVKKQNASIKQSLEDLQSGTKEQARSADAIRSSFAQVQTMLNMLSNSLHQQLVTGQSHN